MTIITDPLFYALAIPAVVALGLSKGGFAGVGQMATPLVALAMPPLEAAAIMLPIMIVQDATAVWVYRREYNARILKIMIPGALAGIALAGLLASYISDSAVRIFIGVTTILFVLYSWIGPKKLAEETKTASVPAGVFWGAVSGFTSTICQAGGPPYQMYVLSQNLPKMVFVGTTAIMFATLNWVKVIPYAALGQFSSVGLMTSLALLPLAIVTNQLGFWLVRRTPQKVFYQVTMVLMLLISIELTREGVTDLWPR
ncbi:sulfite exporter TauE/SafE family protein [Pseudolabrys taiwanensis]|uniref:Probable membrane transporter protein n=1 Tax=Pseudolabrys taiwanensis TaxID=331696 RepID=A0A346A219_9HYPH|nr:sulfite exporter TauE/SafE family protein [Pseudolabrys taiwanensis]AXK83216.1 sulfite exporter TauE/SafE family protein [Pseudolabrys taiwanensis]